ncbi:MAG TPA: plasmid pRiA4b ORF-3 family protein [Candidatus Polarisedimenticolia bacterium]|jgi:hypothetical protein|nr:plasmid pRiA4b ORF-3 family protein [Candidatus Polarisedimenticolia bacterium]
MARRVVSAATRERVYQIKVTLRDSRPAIWRRFEILSSATLDEVHRTLQIVMGWTDSHLHHFVVGEHCYGGPDPEESHGEKDERRMRLDKALRKPKDKIRYEYDFGDSWLHHLVLERIRERDPRERYPVILDAQGACPPENVGGISGYYEFLQAISNPRHREHKSMREWWGGSFDPCQFDIEDRNRALHRRRRTA